MGVKESEVTHFHKEIWEEMTADVKVRNRQAKMVQAQLARIEKKLFTELETIEFLVGLVKDMTHDK